MSRAMLKCRMVSSLSLRERAGVRGNQAKFAESLSESSVAAPHPNPLPKGGRTSRAFTLVEVLAALLLIAIVLPVVMQGISLATNAASDAKRRTEAAGLAESKLGEIVATRQWLAGGLSGDFAPDWPDYRWEALLQPYANDSSGKSVQQIDLRVIWTARSREQSVSVSTLAFARTTTTSE